MGNSSFVLSSDLLLNKDATNFLTLKRVELLENIRDYGSITKAAKASGVTYKTAWDWIDKMNALSAKSLVQKLSGGKDGGGTVVTAYASELIRIYHEVNALHQKHLDSLQSSLDFIEDDIAKKTFSFSRLNAHVKEIHKHENRTELLMSLEGGYLITAYCSANFIKVNDIKAESMVSLLIESDTVLVSKEIKEKISSRNSLETEVIEIDFQGDDVLLRLGLGQKQTLTSRITRQSFKNLEIKIGDTLVAMFKAYSVTLLRGER